MRPLAPLVGLYSPAPGSGKTTLAAAMHGLGWRTVKFAGPLKAMLRAMLAEVGEDAAAIERMVEGDLKETPAPALAGRTPRHAMQTLGTEWGRECVAPDLWVRLFLRSAFLLRERGIPVVCDDMRFANEAATIRQAGGLLVKLVRPGAAGRPGGHASEGALCGLGFDLTVTNDHASAAALGRAEAPRVSAAAWAAAEAGARDPA